MTVRSLGRAPPGARWISFECSFSVRSIMTHLKGTCESRRSPDGRFSSLQLPAGESDLKISGGTIRKLQTLAASILILVLAAVPSKASPATDLSPAEMRGRAIYRKGESASGQIIGVFIGGGDTEIESKLVPCGSCHGMDGRGRP